MVFKKKKEKKPLTPENKGSGPQSPLLPLLFLENKRCRHNKVGTCKEILTWFVLNSSICGCQPSKFLSRSALVQNFPSEFALVKLVGVKDLAVLDRRSCGGESVAVASLFGVVRAVTRRTIKPSEVICYRWLIHITNDLKIDLGSEREQHLNSPTILPSKKTTIFSVHFLLLAWNRQNLLRSRVCKKKTLS